MHYTSMYKPRAVQLRPNGGQIDFVRPPHARTPNGAVRMGSLTESRKYPPETYYRSFCARRRFPIISHSQPTRLAFKETAEVAQAEAEAAPDDPKAGSGKKKGKPRASKKKNGKAAAARSGTSQEPSIQKKGFRHFLSRVFKYTKLYFTFLYLDTSPDKRVDFDEYVAGEPFNSTPNGGQSDFACPPTRMMHPRGAYVW